MTQYTRSTALCCHMTKLPHFCVVTVFSVTVTVSLCCVVMCCHMTKNYHISAQPFVTIGRGAAEAGGETQSIIGVNDAMH